MTEIKKKETKARVVDKTKHKIEEREIEDFKRPDHLDFMTTEELKKAEFTGYRQNSVSGNSEIWLMGELKASIGSYELDQDPQAINKAMQEIFMLDNVMPDTPVARLYGHAIDSLETNSKSNVVLPFDSPTKH